MNNEKVITAEAFQSFCQTVETNYTSSLKKLQQLRSDRMLAEFRNDTRLLNLELDDSTDALIEEWYQLSVMTEIILLKNFAQFKQESSRVEESDGLANYPIPKDQPGATGS